MNLKNLFQNTVFITMFYDIYFMFFPLHDSILNNSFVFIALVMIKLSI